MSMSKTPSRDFKDWVTDPEDISKYLIGEICTRIKQGSTEKDAALVEGVAPSAWYELRRGTQWVALEADRAKAEVKNKAMKHLRRSDISNAAYRSNTAMLEALDPRFTDQDGGGVTIRVEGMPSGPVDAGEAEVSVEDMGEIDKGENKRLGEGNA